MFRKIVAVWVSLAMLLGFIVILDVVTEITPQVKASILYVNTTGTGGAYTSIQDAINASNSGDTVFVYNGTYYENVVVNKTINLTGEDQNTTIIDGGGNGDVVNISVDFVNIHGFTITNSGSDGSHPYYDAGIKLYYIQSCNISGNKLLSNNNGISVTGSSNNVLCDNNASNNLWGIFLLYANGNMINDNKATLNYECGIYLWISSDNNLINNNVSSNGLSGIYLIISSNNNTIKKCISNGNGGISGYGIIILGSSNNTIGQCVLNSNDYNGIHVRDTPSSNTVIINNTVSLNKGYGIMLYQSSPGHIVSYNRVYKNTYDGLVIFQTLNNTVEKNHIFSNNRHGINIAGSDNNVVKNNTLHSMGEYGIYVIGYYNKIYHNNLFNNAYQAYDGTDDNFWDNGYPSGGNYWSDYNGSDELSGPGQNISGGDGIGDIMYSIDNDSADNYPLMKPNGPYIFLYKGWNLISIPNIQPNTATGNVLSSICDSYDSLQWYNSTDSENPWKHDSTSKPSLLNGLLKIDHFMGFWIHVTKSNGTLFKYYGYKPISNQSIPLHPGWNMVGYPSLSNRNRTAALNNIIFDQDVDAVWTFDATTQTWQEIGPSDYFELGRGYWIHSKVTKVWDVPL